MNDIEKILKECSIQELYSQGNATATTYQIPIYQRNYAWERDEIRNMLDDVWDAFQKNKEAYYIGTLVTYKREENTYEIIDGQQRLTTIYLILKAMKVHVTNKLTYTARKTSARTLEALPKTAEDPDKGINNGFKYVQESIREIACIPDLESAEQNETYLKYKDYFLKKVRIVHYQVPRDVDLNHYFEVMNSRGEQLEKHEIVKAKLLNIIKGNGPDVVENEANKSANLLNLIWEACSEMSIYAQQKFPVFGPENRHMLKEDLFDGLHSEDGSIGKIKPVSISDILAKAEIKGGLKDETDRNDRFQPIIDFPNFLLIVLKITRFQDKSDKDFKPQEFTLDDKDLIEEFDKYFKRTEERSDLIRKVKTFAENLLRARYYLDNYVVHHINSPDRVNENPWKLQRYSDGIPKNLAGQENEEAGSEKRIIQLNLVHLLSMFEVTFTPRQRKNYLFYCLLHLFKDDDIDSYIEFLRALAERYFFNVYLNEDRITVNQPKPNSFDEEMLEKSAEDTWTLIEDRPKVSTEDARKAFESIYNCTDRIPLFIFNYTDYKLWEKYAVEILGENKAREEFFKDLGCSEFRLDIFKNFYFSRTRKSLEHFFPRAKIGEKDYTLEEINNFGNFAMIGADANSSGSNWDPISKKEHYRDSKINQLSVASLKFRIMLQICADENGWTTKEMAEHQDNILKILFP